MPPLLQSVLRGYAIPVLTTAAAALARWALGPLSGDTIPFMTFYPAIALSGWFGGLRAGLLATLLSAATAAGFFAAARSAEALTHPGVITSLVLFTLVGALLSWLTHERARAQARVRAIHEAERQARLTAQAAAERVGRLQQITAALANALTTEQVADVIMTHALPAFGANAGVAAVLSDGGQEFVCVGSAGYPPEAMARYARLPAEGPFALADAVRRREPVILPTAQERYARYPHHAALRAVGGDGAGVALPLLLKDHAVGALGLSFPQDRTFAVEEVNFFFTVARQCAQALDRARSYEAEGRARERAEQEVAGRKRVEAALEQSERVYRQMFENNPQPMWVFDRDTLAILAVNDAAVAHYGYTRDEFLAMSVRDLRPPADAPGPPITMPPAEGGISLAVSRRHRKKDGTLIAVEMTVHPLLFAGRPAALALAHDVTERVRSAEALREGAERLRLALETGRLGSWELDAARGVLTCSALAQVHLDLPPGAEYPYETFWQVIHPEDRARVRAALERARAEQADCDAEYRCVWPDGSVRWLVVRGRGVADPAGPATRLVGVSIDVTEHRQAEEALRRREREFQTLVENSPDVISRLDRDLRYVYVNPAIERATGLKPQAFLGKTRAEIGLPPEITELLDSTCREALLSGQERHCQIRIATADGPRCYQARIVPEFAADGTVESVLGISTDVTELKQVEAALRESEERLRFALTASRVVAWEWDLTASTCVRIGSSVEILGIGSGLADDFHRRVHPDDRLLVQGAVACAVEQGGPYDLEYRLQLPDGRVRWIADKARVRYGPDGRPTHLTGVCVDITERKLLEAELRRREREFATLVENSPDVVFRLDCDLRHVYINPAVERTTGRKPLHFLGRTGQEAGLPPELWERFEACCQEALWTGQAQSMEFTSQTPQGVRHFESRVIPETGPDGEVGSLLGITSDLTERRRAEAALRASEQRFRRVVESDMVGILFWGPEGVITDANDVFLNMVGRTRADLAAGRLRWPDLTPPEWAEADARALEELRTRGTCRPFEKEYLHASGRRVPILLGASCLEGRSDEGVAFLVDITERKKLEAELRERAEQLAEADRKKDEFLATLAHELRNPLAPIRTALEILRLGGGADSEETRAVLERQVQQLVRLVDDLLDVSRITRGKVELRKARVELAAVVNTAVETSQPLLAEAGHELTVALPVEPVHLDADQTRLAQVLANLLNNSARYTPRGGQVWLTAEATDAEVVVRVRDTGVGIPGAMLPRVFDMFTQVNRTLERTQGGLGIGLTLVRRLVELHGGRVEAHSAGPGQGSEFVVRLPRASAPVATVNGSDGGPRPAPGPRRRILAVDDNRDAVESLARLLRLAGHEVQLAIDGPSALEAAAAYRPEVVLLDIGLPGMSGHDVARQLRATPEGRGLLLVAVSGWGQEDDRRRSREAGFDHHLVKPVDPDALRQLLAAPREPAAAPGE
jgi:PAS domain S-box-containing protein